MRFIFYITHGKRFIGNEMLEEVFLMKKFFVSLSVAAVIGTASITAFAATAEQAAPKQAPTTINQSQGSDYYCGGYYGGRSDGNRGNYGGCWE